MEEAKLIVLDNIKDFGEKVERHLQSINGIDNHYIIPIKRERFSNGEGKVQIDATVRDKDIYILSDVGNYNITYNLRGMNHVMSPDEHFQDLKRVISAIGGEAYQINVVTPLLYQSRQHRIREKESTDCVDSLKELELLGVNRIITFDAHDPNVANAIHPLPFKNYYAAHEILSEMIDNEDLSNPFVISPDFGATERANYLAELIGSDVGIFHKRRDRSVVVNGKNPIVEHVYIGADVRDKNVIVVDDMIASGSSMIDVAYDLKKRNANNIYFVSTFSLLTEGPDVFSDAYKDGLFTRLYSTNLTYVPEDIKNSSWFSEVDMSGKVAKIIDTINKKESLKPLFNGKKEIREKLKVKKLIR